MAMLLVQGRSQVAAGGEGGVDLTYVVADLHGSDDLLASALMAMSRDAATAEDGRRTAVFLGDYVDRGPGSRLVLDRLMSGPPPGWVWLCLKGNHEQMMLDVCDDLQPLAWWLENGGDATLVSFGASPRLPPTAVLPAEYLAWVRALPPLAVDRHRVFVHAGIDPTLRIDEQDEETLLWSRSSNRLGHRGRFVVHGHTPHRHGPVAEGRSLNLDTLAWATGRLVLAVFDDARAGGPVRTIEVLRSPTDPA